MNRKVRYYLLSLTLNLPMITWAQTEEPYQLKTADLLLDGTLMLPTKQAGSVPVALFIAGSGPTDRNGNNPIPVGQVGSVKANSYRMLADSLAKLGVASVRYDKRLIGRSTAVGLTEQTLTFESYIKDAEDWVDKLRKDQRFSKIVVVGHSEGSLIGMVAARRAKANGFISLAGPGDEAGQKLKDQLRFQLPTEARESVFKALDSLKAGFTLGQLPTTYPAIHQLFRPSIQPYMIAWMRYDPAAQLRQLTIPVLIIQGKRDIQVGVADAEKLHQALPSAQYLLFDTMSYGLKNVTSSSMQEAAQSYNDPSGPLTPGLAASVASFVKQSVR